MKTQVRLGICKKRALVRGNNSTRRMKRERERGRITISESRAKAGSKVGGASRCLSTASNTSTNLHLGSRVRSFSIVLMATDSCAIVSQRLCLPGSEAGVEDDDSAASMTNCKASATDPTIRSNKCRDVMHWAALTTAYPNPPLCGSVAMCSASRASSCSVMLDLPVDSVPWTTRFRQGAALGCEGNMISKRHQWRFSFC
jgi:hypothetical protein